MCLWLTAIPFFAGFDPTFDIQWKKKGRKASQLEE
jgi:hypothetical protein